MNQNNNIFTDNSNLTHEELNLADKVADEILRKKENKRIIFLLLFIAFIFILFLFSFYLFQINKGSNENNIQSGSILFSYNTSSNSIDIVNALPMSDELGKQLRQDNEYFEFSVGVEINSNITKSVTYEISLTPSFMTLNPNYVRIYLTENGKDVLINSNSVNNYSELPNSNKRNNSKLLLKKVVKKSEKNIYVFKMWISDKYEITNVTKQFTCFVNIDAY